MDKRIDEIQQFKAREDLLRSELRDIKAKRENLEQDIIEEMCDDGEYQLNGSDCRVELRSSTAFDRELAQDSLPYALHPEVWSISARNVKKTLGARGYREFTPNTGDVYLKFLS